MSPALTPAGAGDASGRAPRLRAGLADLARFAVRPTFAAQPMAWGRAAALVLAMVFALDLACGWLADALLGVVDPEGTLLPTAIEEDISLAEDLFTALILAPVLEELLFRGWLTGRRAALRFALWGLAALALFAMSILASPPWTAALALAGVAAAFAGLIGWSRTHHRDTAVPAWFLRRFHWCVWGSTLLFGLIHLGNYAPLTHPLGLLVVLPQTIGGLMLAYTRSRLGLGAAMAHHAAYNAVLMAGEYGGW